MGAKDSEAAALRAAAKAAGAKTFDTGRPCKNGHVSPRYAGDGKCVACIAERNAARNSDPEFVEQNRAYHKKRREENQDAFRARQREYYALNSAKLIAAKKAKREADPEHERIIRAAYYERNKEKFKAMQVVYRQENREKRRAWNANRKAQKRQAEGCFTADDINRIRRDQKGKCAYCRGSLDKLGEHQDHIISLAAGGTNWPSNIQLTCPSCNCSKRHKDPVTFARQLGRLL